MRRAVAFAVACASLVAMLSAAPAAADDHRITFNVLLAILPCVNGTGPAGQVLTLSLKTPSGDLRGRSRASIDEEGRWDVCLGALEDQINSGDRIIAKVGSVKREWTIPRLSLHADRRAGILTGQTVPNGHLTVAVIPTLTLHPIEYHVVANSTGRFRLSVGPNNLVGGSFVVAMLNVGQDAVEAVTASPAMLVRRGMNTVVGVVNGYQPVHVQLIAKDGRVRASVTVQAVNGITWSAALMDAQGRPAYPEAGETVRASSARDEHVVVPEAAIHGAAPTDIVSGKCMSNAKYVVEVEHAVKGFYRFFEFDGTTSATGHLFRSTSSKFDLTTGDQLMLECLYPSGDIYELTNIAR